MASSLRSLESGESATMSDEVLRVDALCKSFGGVRATDDVSFDVRAGELHALIGPNGAGKTTLIAQLSGLLAPDSGRVSFNGHDVTRLPAHKLVKRGLARSFQITSVFPDMSAIDNVAMAVQANHGHSFRFWAKAASDQALLGKAAGFLSETGLSARTAVRARELSHGERRQLEIAMALATEPDLLLLDEPMAGMGLEESASVVALLNTLKGDKSLLMVEHDMDAVFALADRISVLVYGRLIATGTPAEIRANEEVRRAYLGED